MLSMSMSYGLMNDKNYMYVVLVSYRLGMWVSPFTEIELCSASLMHAREVGSLEFLFSSLMTSASVAYAIGLTFFAAIHWLLMLADLTTYQLFRDPNLKNMVLSAMLKRTFSSWRQSIPKLQKVLGKSLLMWPFPVISRRDKLETIQHQLLPFVQIDPSVHTYDVV
eukprot:m.200075 g.200075  ORF g.200075 m.200075 type:complete len:166 (+) comp14954_c0_seq2:1006-1503(+)